MACARIVLCLSATLCRIFFFCGVKNHLKEDRRSYIRIIILSWVYNKPTQRTLPNWLVSLIGRALHRYRKSQGFESRTSLNFFFVRLSFRNCKSCVCNCDYLPSKSVGSVCTGDFPKIFLWFSFDFPLFSNIVGATHAHYTWSPKSYGLYPFPRCTTGRNVVGSCCKPLPTRTPQLSQHC